jgi:CheY-like chemotaxis protein
MASKANIMIVEDEAVTAKDMQVQLQNMGYSVPFVAATGNEDFESYLKYKTPPPPRKT